MDSNSVELSLDFDIINKFEEALGDESMIHACHASHQANNDNVSNLD